jgi:hypothetical protein
MMSQPTDSTNLDGQETTPNSVASPRPNNLLKSWKTTGIGIVLSLTGFVAFSPSTFGGEQAPLVQVCKYITSGGLAALGIAAKDFNVTNGK